MKLNERCAQNVFECNNVESEDDDEEEEERERETETDRIVL